MNRERCPWCGKRVDYHHDAGRARDKKLPRFFCFARCSNCDGYYGQAVYDSTYMKIMFWLFLPVTVITFAFEFAPLMVVYIALIFPSVFVIPFDRMDSNGRLSSDLLSEEHCSGYSGNEKIIKNHLYFLSDDFDGKQAFSSASPLLVDVVDKKRCKVYWHFLYEHAENAKYTESEEFKVYDSDMQCIGNFITE